MNTQRKYDSLLQGITVEDMVLSINNAPTTNWPTEISAFKTLSVLAISEEKEYKETIGRDGKPIAGSRKYITVQLGTNLESEADVKTNSSTDEYGRVVISAKTGKNHTVNVFESSNPVAYNLLIANEAEVLAGNVAVEIQEVRIVTPDYYPFSGQDIVLNERNFIVVRGEPITTAIRRELKNLDWVSKRRVAPEEIDEHIEQEHNQQQQQAAKQPLKRTVAR